MKLFFIAVLFSFATIYSQSAKDPLAIMMVFADSSMQSGSNRSLTVKPAVFFSEQKIPQKRMNQVFNTDLFLNARIFYGMSLNYQLNGNSRNLFTWHFILSFKDRNALKQIIQRTEKRILVSKVFTRIEVFESDSGLVVLGTESIVADSVMNLIISKNELQRLRFIKKL